MQKDRDSLRVELSFAFVMMKCLIFLVTKLTDLCVMFLHCCCCENIKQMAVDLAVFNSDIKEYVLAANFEFHL